MLKNFDALDQGKYKQGKKLHKKPFLYGTSQVNTNANVSTSALNNSVDGKLAGIENLLMKYRKPKYSRRLPKISNRKIEYSSVQDWLPKEVNIFLKRFAKDWNMLKNFGFEKHKVMSDALLELKANNMCNAGLSFLVADEFENTIHIQSYNDEDELLGKFEEYTNVDGTGLESINDDNEIPKVIASLNHFQPSRYYRMNAFHLKEVNWSKVEDQATEEETLLAIQNVPTEKIKAPIKNFPNRVMNNQEGKPLVE
nr:6037_t:CDS:2 [Entrophospora candida]